MTNARPHQLDPKQSTARYYPRAQAVPFISISLGLAIIGSFAPVAALLMGESSSFIATRFNISGLIFSSFLVFGFSLVLAAIYYITPKNEIDTSPSPYFRGTVTLWTVSLVASVSFLGHSPAEIASNIALLLRKTRGATEYQAFLYTALTVLVFQLGFIAAATEHQKSKNRYIALIICSIVTAILCFACGSRARALLAFIIPALYVGMARGVSIFTISIFGILAVPVVYFGDIVRRLAQGQSVMSGQNPLSTLANAYSLSDPMAVALYLTERAPTTGLSAIKASMTWFLPASWVESKDWVGSITARYYLYGDTITGITLGTAGEMVYYFGYLGLILGAVLIGFILKRFSYICNGSILSATSHLILCTFLFSSIRNGIFLDLLNYFIIGGLFCINLMIVKTRSR